MNLSGVLSIYSFAWIISTTSARAFQVNTNTKSNILEDVIGNIRMFKKGVLNFLIQPMKQNQNSNLRPINIQNHHIHEIRPVKATKPVVQFSANPVFIVGTTQGPPRVEKEKHKEEDPTENTLYRQDVLSRQLHNMKTRKKSIRFEDVNRSYL